MAEKASMAEFVALGKKIKAGNAAPGDMARFTKLGKLIYGGQFTGTTPAKAAPKAAPPGRSSQPLPAGGALQPKKRPKPMTGTPGGIKEGRKTQPRRTRVARPPQEQLPKGRRQVKRTAKVPAQRRPTPVAKPRVRRRRRTIRHRGRTRVRRTR